MTELVKLVKKSAKGIIKDKEDLDTYYRKFRNTVADLVEAEIINQRWHDKYFWKGFSWELCYVISDCFEAWDPVLWKLWILQSYSWKTRHGSTISGTLKQRRLILISLQTLIRSFIYPSEEQLLIVTFLVTGSNRLLTQSLFFLFINLPCNT